MSAATPLFDEVVEASGLNRLIAPFTISRLLARDGVTPEELTPELLIRVLPGLEEGLSVYLRGAELDRALADIRRLGSSA